MQFSNFRIIDANLNRFREGLRVIEEWCRFRVENVLLAETCKILRHEITTIFIDKGLFKEQLLRFRDTESDIGTKISTSQEYFKKSEKEILLANFGRMQESLRVLEEFGKLESLGPSIEHIRYRVYSLEKEVIHTVVSQNLACSVYVLLTQSLCKNNYFSIIEELCIAGVRIFQIREKDITDHALFQLVKKVLKITQQYNASVIINDRLDIALVSGADGVHLGQEDMPIADVRKNVGRPFLIGATVHTVNELEALPMDAIDYIGVGPCFPSTTKPNLLEHDLELIGTLIQKSSVPAFAIGGVSEKNVVTLLSYGVKQIAVCSSIISDKEPLQAYLKLLKNFSIN